MTRDEAAAQLHGNEYGREGSDELFAVMKENGLVAVFGYSDDNIEFRGAIYDELGAGDETKIRMTREGFLVNKCHDDDCPYFKAYAKQIPVAITARWCSHDDYSWFIETDLPHAVFDIAEDDGLYCRGVVISVEDLPAK